MSRAALIWNSFSGTALYATTVIVSFTMAPFLVHRLGDARYGFWELLLGLVGYLGILDLGVAPAIVRFVALAAGSNDAARLRRVVNAGFATFLVAGCLGALVVAAVSLRPALVFGPVPMNPGEARRAILLSAVIFLLTFTRATFSAALMGLQYHRVVNATRVATSLLAALAIYVFLRDVPEHPLLRVAAVAAAVAGVETLFFAVLLSTKIGGGLAPWTARWDEGRDLFGFGAKSAGLMASSQLVRQGVLFVLAHGPGAAAVTIYVLAGRLVDYGQQLGSAIGFPLAPYLTSAFGSGGLDGARQAWLSTTRVMQFIQGGVAMGVTCLGLPFLARWMGPDYAARGAPVFHWLCGAMLFQLLGCNANRMLVGLNQHGRAALGALALGGVSLLVAILAVPYFGVAGAAAAACLFMCGLNAIELVLVGRALQLDVGRLVGGTLRRTYPAVALGCTAMTAMSRFYAPDTYRAIAITGVVGAIAYVLVSSVVSMDSAERGRLVAMLQRRVSAGNSVSRTS